MQHQTDKLKIASEELDNLVDLDIISAIAVDAYGALFLKNYRKIIALLVNELFVILLVLIVTLPAIILWLRSVGHTSLSLVWLLLLILGSSFAAIFGINYYFWQQVKKIGNLAKLLDDIDKYNQVIQNIEMLHNLEAARKKSFAQEPSDRKVIIEALKKIKANLLAALKVEKIIRKNQQIGFNQYELLSQIEDNFTDLLLIEHSHDSDQYEQLLDEALQISISVQKEVKKLHKKNFN